MSEIPVIDLTLARQGGYEGKQKVARQIDQACRETGFMTIVGHGIEHRIFAQLEQAMDQFFDLPLEQKMACRTQDRPCPHQRNGYSALQEENAYAFMGKKGMPSDHVEKFSMGSALLDDEYPLPFPSETLISGFRQAAKHYYQACLSMADMLTELFAMAVELPQDFFSDKIHGASDYLRMQRYPAYSKAVGSTQGLAPHTDIVLFAIVSSAVAGIEVRNSDGHWIRPQVVDRDQFIVNIGDLAQRWSNDVWRSTEHRVVLTDQVRGSVIFFKEVKADTLIETFAKFGQSKYKPVTFGHWIKAHTEALFSDH